MLHNKQQASEKEKKQLVCVELDPFIFTVQPVPFVVVDSIAR